MFDFLERCYLATNCEDNNDTEIVDYRGVDPLDVNLVYVFSQVPDKTWSIEVIECGPEPTLEISVSNIVTTYLGCSSYRLSDCNSKATDIVVSNDLSQYVGRIVKIRGSSCCYTVEETDERNSRIEYVQFEFYTCDECLGVPIYQLVKPQRYVAPGYKYAVCSTDFIDKVKCGFVNVMFKKMKSTLFEIKLCTKGDDKLLLQNEELNLKLIQDKTEDLQTNYDNCCKTFEFILNLNISETGTVSGLDCNGENVLVNLEECNPRVELCLDINFDIQTVGEIEIVRKNDCRL